MSIALVEARGPEGLEVERVQTAHPSLSEAAREEPGNGVYLVARTYRGGHVLELDAHFDRMERSAVARGHAIHVPRQQIRSLLREMLQEMPRKPGAAPGDAARGDGRFRVTAVLDDSPWYRLAMEPAAEVDPELLRGGVHCSVHRGTVRAEAEVKSTAWMAERRSLTADSAAPEESAGADSAAPEQPARGSAAEPVYEHLLAREDGAILEGASSNFYACIGTTVHTSGEGVLRGIARRIVLTVIEEMASAVTVDFEPVAMAQLESGAIDEAFITSATRGVVPVRSIDTVELGPPGPVTTEISRRYGSWLEAHLKPL